MKKIFFFILIFFTLSGCDEEEQMAIKIDNGIYEGTFQREIISSENETAKITLTFSSNKWSGTSEFAKYPALCHGTFTIVSNSIFFTNDCAWTAEFDWSLILSGEYSISKNGENIEFTRDYKIANSGSYTDRYILTKQE